MAQCINKIAKDFGFDCDDTIKGVELSLLLFNRDDIDLAATVVEGNRIKSLVMKTGKTAYKLAYDKESHISVSTKPEISDDDFNGHKHAVVLNLYGKSQEDYDQIDKIVAGASVVAVVQNKTKSLENTFDVYGYYIGLEATEGEGRTNGGVYKLTLGTPNNQKEPKTALRWLDTDYATTKGKFDNKLA